MNFCYLCRQKLPLGTEKFCPNCGEKFVSSVPNKEGEDGDSITVHGNSGEVIGVGVKGTGNFIGKEIAYTVQGNIINFHVNNLSVDVVEELKRMLSVETRLPSIVDAKEDNKTNLAKLSVIDKTQEKITRVLNDVERIEKIEGTQIEEIKAGGIQVLKKDLLAKDALTRASTFYYTGQYKKALEWYDKLLLLDSEKADVWFNKGLILAKLERYIDAIKCFDRAIKIKRDHATAWYNMGVCFGRIGQHRDAIKCFDKIREIGMLVQ